MGNKTKKGSISPC